MKKKRQWARWRRPCGTRRSRCRTARVRRSAVDSGNVSSCAAGFYSTAPAVHHRILQHRAGAADGDEQVFGIGAIRSDRVVDRHFVVGVQIHPGQVLQPQVAVAVDLGSRHPRLKIARPPAVRGQQIDDRRKSHFANRPPHCLREGSLNSSDKPLDIDLQFLVLPQAGRCRSPCPSRRCSRSCRSGRPRRTSRSRF